MHFEWSCALKATGLMVGGCASLVGILAAIFWLCDSMEGRWHNATGGRAAKVGGVLGKVFAVGVLSLAGLLLASIIWFECYKAVCPMARMPHAKAAPAVAEAKPVGTPQEGTDR